MSKQRFSRKLVALLIAVVLVVSLLPGAALAADGPRQARPSVSICSSIVSQMASRMLDSMVAAANARVNRLVRIAQATPYDDVDWLLWQVELTVYPVFAYAERIGAVVVCEYVAYEIDGQTVLVDPLRVVKR